MLRQLALLTLLVSLLSACQSSSGVVTDYDPATNFGSYQTYRWMEDTSGGDAHLGPLMIQRVREAMQRQLRLQRFREAAADEQPDFLVRYYVTEAPETHRPPPRVGIGLGSFGRNVGVGVSTSAPLGQGRISRNLQIIIDLMDSESQRLTWRGSRVFELKSEDPRDVTEAVETRVQEIWAEFPPKR